MLCQRYIELNPVRAAMVDDPAHYRWSSYRANGLGQTDPLLTSHPLYAELGRDEADRLALNQGQPLGGSRFVDSIEQATGQRREVRPRGRPRKPEAEIAPENTQLSIDI